MSWKKADLVALEPPVPNPPQPDAKGLAETGFQFVVTLTKLGAAWAEIIDDDVKMNVRAFADSRPHRS